MKNKLLLIAAAVFLTSTVFSQIPKKSLISTPFRTQLQRTSSRTMAPAAFDTAFSLFPQDFPGDTDGVIYGFGVKRFADSGYALGTNYLKFTACAETYDWAVNKTTLNGATFFFEVAKFKKGKGTDTITVRVYKTAKGGSKPTGLGLTEKAVTLTTIANNIKAGNITKVAFKKTITMDTTHTWMIAFSYKANGGDTIACASGEFRGNTFTNTWIKYPWNGTTQTWFSSSSDTAFGDGISMFVGAWIHVPKTANSPAVEKMVYNTGMSVSAFPNPSNGSFKLNIMTPMKDPITVRVMDVSGRQVAVYNQVAANQIFEFGNNLTSGAYLVQVVQGSTIQSFKLIKN
jgi:hypothetical protein